MGATFHPEFPFPGETKHNGVWTNYIHYPKSYTPAFNFFLLFIISFNLPRLTRSIQLHDIFLSIFLLSCLLPCNMTINQKMKVLEPFHSNFSSGFKQTKYNQKSYMYNCATDGCCFMSRFSYVPAVIVTQAPFLQGRVWTPVKSVWHDKGGARSQQQIITLHIPHGVLFDS